MTLAVCVYTKNNDQSRLQKKISQEFWNLEWPPSGQESQLDKRMKNTCFLFIC